MSSSPAFVHPSPSLSFSSSPLFSTCLQRHRNQHLDKHLVKHTRSRRRPAHVITTTTAVLQQPANAAAHSANETTGAVSAKEATLRRFVTWFQGDFDNYDQAAADRAPDSEVPRRGRHEHIHCRVQPLPATIFGDEASGSDSKVALFATYWYDGNTDIVYRRRVYTFNHVPAGGNNADDADFDDNVVQMHIYKMGFIHGLKVARANCEFDGFDFGCIDDGELYERLEGAEITWRYADTPLSDEEQGKDLTVNDSGYFKGTMQAGGFTAADGLRYDDTLILTPEDLWVGERVYNSENVQVGGNQYNIPHKMRRIRHDDELKWTLNRDIADVNLFPRRDAAV